jgi:serralysin
VFIQVGADGALLSDAFVANLSGVAEDAEDRLIYDTDSGNLIYDSNGNAQGGAVRIATLGTGLALDSGDFLVI